MPVSEELVLFLFLKSLIILIMTRIIVPILLGGIRASVSCWAVAASVRDFYNSVAVRICSSHSVLLLGSRGNGSCFIKPRRLSETSETTFGHTPGSLQRTPICTQNRGEMGFNAQERFGLEVKREKRAKQT